MGNSIAHSLYQQQKGVSTFSHASHYEGVGAAAGAQTHGTATFMTGVNVGDGEPTREQILAQLSQ
jgi:hypothetical protein